MELLHRYRHIVEISIEQADTLDRSWRLGLLLKAIHQVQRAGILHDVVSQEIKDDRVELVWETTCPYHDLGLAQVVFRVSRAVPVTGSREEYRRDLRD